MSGAGRTPNTDTGSPGGKSNTQRDLASLAGCIYREKSIESSSVTADPSAIGQIGRRPAHLHGTRANDSKGALAIAHGRLARYAQIPHNADHVFVERLAAEFNAAALAIERVSHELNLLSRGEADVRRELYGRSSLNGGGQLVGGSNRYGLTGLGNARIARLLAFGAVFGILRLGSIPLVLPKRSCKRHLQTKALQPAIHLQKCRRFLRPARQTVRFRSAERFRQAARLRQQRRRSYCRFHWGFAAFAIGILRQLSNQRPTNALEDNVSINYPRMPQQTMARRNARKWRTRTGGRRRSSRVPA